jgi:hypothetical protein
MENREELFECLDKRKYERLFEIMEGKVSEIKNDNVATQAVSMFFLELARNLNNKLNTAENRDMLERLEIMHSVKSYILEDEHREIIIESLTRFHSQNGDTEIAFGYAKRFPTNLFCRKTITEYQEKQPATVEHSNISFADVKVNSDSFESRDAITSIFNSKQERIFFKALVRSFPMYYCVPNVPISAIINFDAIKDLLDKNERNYFFKAQIDFVVFDQFSDFWPLVAIELDSEWHRQEGASVKDEMKNKILGSASLKLFRIEHRHKHKTVEEFQSLIRETIVIPD